VNEHILLKLREPVPDAASVPDWHRFIADKSSVREQVEPGIDRLMRAHGLPFWLTHEYTAAGDSWSADERRHGLDRTYRLILQGDVALPPSLVGEIRAEPSVEHAHGVYVAKAPMPDFATESSLLGPSPSELIYLEFAKSLTRGHPEIRVAVLDTGADLDHPELQGRIVEHANFVNLDGLDTRDFIGHFHGESDYIGDELGHGNHVSGIIGARGLRMDEGVAPACSLVAVRVLATIVKDGRRYGAGIVDNINRGIKFAADTGRADVINMSLGIKHEAGSLPHADIIRYALSQGVTVVAASGNDGSPERYYPGALPGVCAVGAVGGDGAVAPFTSYGAPITCVAPGTNIYSCFADHGYAVASGTSQASPFVAGAVALMKAYARDQGRRLSPALIADLLERTSDKVDTQLRNERAGYGLLNLADGFKYLIHSLN
jgi:thermitase